MNLLENYIVEIISEEVMEHPITGNPFYKVTLISDCYGAIEQTTRWFSIDEWKKAKERGFFIS